MASSNTHVGHGVPEHRPAGHDRDAGQPFVVGERRVHGQGAALRETRQHRLGGRHFRRSDLVVHQVVQLVHGPHDARLVFHLVLVQRRQVEPRGGRETLVQRQRYLFPAGTTVYTLLL